LASLIFPAGPVRSWDLRGEPAPGVPFSWYATVFNHLE
jgi:hypothetical protein